MRIFILCAAAVIHVVEETAQSLVGGCTERNVEGVKIVKLRLRIGEVAKMRCADFQRLAFPKPHKARECPKTEPKRANQGYAVRNVKKVKIRIRMGEVTFLQLLEAQDRLGETAQDRRERAK